MVSPVRTLRLALAQINATVGDLDGNTGKIIRHIDQARDCGADLVAFPELAITGYPPEDLLLKPRFIADNLDRLAEIVHHTRGIAAVVGFADADGDIFNAAAIIHDGRLVGVHHKNYLPNYGVFDEDRYFRAGQQADVYVVNGVRVGVSICEDIWYPVGPATTQAAAGAELILNVNASPYHAGKRHQRERMLATRAADNMLIVAYVNMVGGQDELVFDGASLIFRQSGELLARGTQFAEDLVVADLDVEGVFRARLHDPRRRKAILSTPPDGARCIPVSDTPSRQPKPSLPDRHPVLYESPAEVYQALVLGTRDYVQKNGFRKVLVGLSGGIDSSLTAVIACDALGAGNVIGVTMPSRYSSPISSEDAHKLAANLGMHVLTIPIEPAFQAYLDMLSEPFAGTQPGIAEENLQARIRGNILMALSNKFGHLVLTTGNKSELAVGYATLYGDMAGGFAVIKDVFKTLVYELAAYRNTLGEVIPGRVLEREPTAELRPNQRDVDSLPLYATLDPILRAYVEEDRSFEQIVAMGFDAATVQRVIAMVDHSEYKRRQAPPGIKITPRAFGRDRRLPITNAFHDRPDSLDTAHRGGAAAMRTDNSKVRGC
jgi:NAD+ synthase (glutamine-hydrolysing)